MARMHGEKLFTGLSYVRGFFFLGRKELFEIEEPYRYSRAFYFRVLPRRVLLTGRWRKSPFPLHEHLIKALGGQVVSQDKISEEEIPGWLDRTILHKGPAETDQDPFF